MPNLFAVPPEGRELFAAPPKRRNWCADDTQTQGVQQRYQAGLSNILLLELIFFCFQIGHHR